MADEDEIGIDEEDSVEHRSSLQPVDSLDPLLGRMMSEQE